MNNDATDGHRINFGQSRADALVSMAEHCLATAGDAANLQSLKGSERCQVMLHVDVHTLRNRAGAAPGPSQCHLDEQPWISAETSRRLSCDASLVTVLEDGRGNVLNIGRRARTVPPALRRALARAAPDVDAQTCVTRWQGEVCDYDMAVGALCARSADA